VAQRLMMLKPLVKRKREATFNIGLPTRLVACSVLKSRSWPPAAEIKSSELKQKGTSIHELWEGRNS
jgi:hypothetical protein